MKKLIVFFFAVICIFMQTQSYSQIPAAPVLVSPENGAVNPVLLDWEDVEYAQTYTVEISLNPSPYGGEYSFSGITVSEFTMPNLPNNQNYYYWHVKSVNTQGAGNWSSVGYFTIYVQPMPAAPVLVSPENGAVNPVLLDWEDVEYAQTYIVEISLNPSPYGGEYSFSGITASEFTLPYLPINENYYYWHVKSVNTQGAGNWSSIRNFIINIQPCNVSVYAGDDKEIFLGYGSESTELTAAVTGGNGPFTYLWSPGGAVTQTITVSPIETTTYTVQVTDNNQCTATDEVIVFVYSTVCGNNGDKVLLCHNGITICVNPSAVPAHLEHGDYLGPCREGLMSVINTIPDNYMLHENYPNPFNPVTRINYSLPFDGKVCLQIFDVTGREVAVLVNENKKAGYYSVDFNASNLSSGIYFYRMAAGDFTAIKKMIVLK